MQTIEIAMEYRQQFNRDIFIDLLCVGIVIPILPSLVVIDLGLKEYGNVGNFNFLLNGFTEFPNVLV